jgi:hypothetical protein
MGVQTQAPPAEATALATAHGQQRRMAVRDLYNTLDGYANRMALRFSGTIALASGLLAWGLSWGRNPVPFVSDMRGFGVLIFLLSIVIAFAVSAVGFVLGVRYRNRLVEPEMRRSWLLPVVPLALAYALVTLVIVGVVLQFIDVAFKELALQQIYAVLVVGLMCGAVAHIVADRTLQITARKLLNVFGIVLFTGVAYSAVNIDNPFWWRESFSFLGEASSSDRAIFNATLIIAGILFVVLQQFFMDLFVDLQAFGLFSARKTRWMRISLIALGVLMAMIGIFPFGSGGIFDTIHSMSAYSIAAILLAYMVFVRRLIPYFSGEFYAMTWFMVGVLVVALLLHFLSSINTAGMELIAFAVAGTWFMLFVNNVQMLVERVDAVGGAPDAAERDR